MSRFSFLFLFSLALFLLAGCQKDDDDAPRPENEVTTIAEAKDLLQQAVAANNLITEVEENPSDTYEVFFEDGTSILIPGNLLDNITEDGETWEAVFAFSDGTSSTGDYLGDTLIVPVQSIRLDPFDTAPLSALVAFETPVPGKFRIEVAGMPGEEDAAVRHDFDYFGAEHELQVLGLYPGHLNQVDLVFTNQAGEERIRRQIDIQTAPLPDGFPTMKIVKPYETAVPPNTVFFVNYRPLHIPFLADQYGRIRWYATGYTQTSKRAFQRLRNGNLLFGADKESVIYEFNMLGQKLNEWTTLPDFQSIHHDVIELPDGNFVVTVDKTGSFTVEDYLVLLDRNSGSITKVWDLNEVMPKRSTLIRDGRDWLHVNAVVYDERDHSLIVSGQRQGIFKITWDNELKWILAPPEGWKEYEPYLLEPVNDVRWIWGQHAPLLMPDGNLFLFDNGMGRDYTADEQYSRGVEFRIVEADTGGTVERVWEYGRERGEDLFSPFISDVDYLPETDTRLIVGGSINSEHTYVDSLNISNVWGNSPDKARIIEVDQDKNVVFEFIVQSEDGGGSVYRAEKMSLYE